MLDLTSIILIFLSLGTGFLVGWLVKSLKSQKQLQQLEIDNSQLQHNEKLLQQQIENLKNDEEQTQKHFELLSNKIFNNQREQFTQQGSQQLEKIIKPMREQLENFRQRLDSVREQEVKERTQIIEKIQQLSQLNLQMSEDAQALTKALTGDSKKQGAWGEMILERVLEISGLQKGREYETQMVVTDEEGNTQRPDVIIKLADNRTIIIDAKVSLSAYHRFIQIDDEQKEEKELQLKMHIQSIKNHIQTLANKQYQNAKEIQGLDFVLMFMPIEGALSITAEQQDDLLMSALQNRILIVTPNTLFGVLRIIHAQWKVDQRSKNAEKIADQGRKLYEQLCSFMEDMDSVGKAINTAQNRFDQAHKRLTSQRGNVIQQAQKLQELGVSSNKQLPSTD